MIGQKLCGLFDGCHNYVVGASDVPGGKISVYGKTFGGRGRDRGSKCRSIFLAASLAF